MQLLQCGRLASEPCVNNVLVGFEVYSIRNGMLQVLYKAQHMHSELWRLTGTIPAAVVWLGLHLPCSRLALLLSALCFILSSPSGLLLRFFLSNISHFPRVLLSSFGFASLSLPHFVQCYNDIYSDWLIGMWIEKR